jgi:hypothetical protein
MHRTTRLQKWNCKSQESLCASSTFKPWSTRLVLYCTSNMARISKLPCAYFAVTRGWRTGMFWSTGSSLLGCLKTSLSFDLQQIKGVHAVRYVRKEKKSISIPSQHSHTLTIYLLLINNCFIPWHILWLQFISSIIQLALDFQPCEDKELYKFQFVYYSVSLLFFNNCFISWPILWLQFIFYYSTKLYFLVGLVRAVGL